MISIGQNGKGRDGSGRATAPQGNYYEMVYYVSVLKENSAYTFVAKTKEEAEEYADEVRQEAISVTISQEGET